ncbi:MAG: phosphoribosylformylglycinamidine synthase, partial [Proteobacteria bacterium]|nr:phosphoribosylformylglycinamidine synthase [Pseudomonadota bacterium]
MPYRLEITLKSDLFDAEGEGIRQKAKNYFGIDLSQVRTIHVVTIDANLSNGQLEKIQTEVFTNPVTQISSFKPLPVEFNWTIWVGYRPGVKDNPGSTAVEAMEDILGIKFGPNEAVYTSKRFCLKGKELTAEDTDKIAGELLANDIIQQWKIYSKEEWDPDVGIGFIIPKVMLNHIPTVSTIPIDSDSTLKQISDKRNLA